MKIGDLAARTGLSVDTLRYYEKIGLIPAPLRDAGGRRVYDASILRWLQFLERLKATGMGIRDRLAYAELRARGAETARERRVMIERHRQKVVASLWEMQKTLELLDEKVETYRKIEAGEIEDPGALPAPRAMKGART
ncbi:MAG: MerR family transcriptional regulator [Pannonibacter sp.]